jgi:hypothetical protein
VSDHIDGIRVLSFEIEGIEAPGRVYAHGAHDGTRRMIVAFSPPGEMYPVRFLYVDGFDSALALAREIGVAHKAGNVDVYVGRHERECEAAKSRAARAPGAEEGR